MPFQEAVVGYRFGEDKDTSESNNEDVEEAQPKTDLEAVMDSLVTLSTSIASLQSQVGN